MATNKYKYYVVVGERRPGVYRYNYHEVYNTLLKHPSSTGKAFKTEKDAWKYFDTEMNKLWLKKIKANYPGSVPVWVHGACRNNGGPNAKAGIGVFWNAEFSGNYAAPLPEHYHQSNNVAQFVAAFTAVEYALNNNINSLCIYSNNIYMLRTLTFWINKWKKNGWQTRARTAVKNREVIEELDDLMMKFQKKGGQVTFLCSRTSEQGNKEAVRLAKKGAKLENTNKEIPEKVVNATQEKRSNIACSGNGTVWVHGACQGSGASNPYAGIGVFWKPGFPGNCGIPLPEQYCQSSNIAQFVAASIAVKRALKNDLSILRIYSNNAYMVRIFATWISKWKENGWMTRAGTQAKNREVIEELDAQVTKFKRKGGRVIFLRTSTNSGDVGIREAIHLAKQGAEIQTRGKITEETQPVNDGKIQESSTIVRRNCNVWIHGVCRTSGTSNPTAGIGVFWKPEFSGNRGIPLSEHYHQSNNVAQFVAASIAVKDALKSDLNFLHVYSNNNFVVNAMSSWIKKWKNNGWLTSKNTPVTNRKEIEELDALVIKFEQRGGRVTFSHIQANRGEYINEVIRLAKEGAKSGVSAIKVDEEEQSSEEVQKSSSDSEGFEKSTSDSEGFEKSTSDGEGFEKSTSDGEGFEKSTSDGEGFEKSTSDGEYFEKSTSDGEVTEKRSADDEVTEKRSVDEVTERRSAEDEVTEKRSADEVTEKRSADDEVTEKRSTDEVTERRSAEDEVTEKRSADDEVTEKRSADDEVTEKWSDDEVQD